MQYGKVVTGSTLAATGVGLGYGTIVLASLAVVLAIVMGIRVFFRRGV